MADLLYHAMVLMNVQVTTLSGHACTRGERCRLLYFFPARQSDRRAALVCSTVFSLRQLLPRLAPGAKGDVPGHQSECWRHCAAQGVSTEEVLKALRGRFGTSGVEEKAARAPKAQ
jgi:hypothetical protein